MHIRDKAAMESLRSCLTDQEDFSRRVIFSNLSSWAVVGWLVPLPNVSLYEARHLERQKADFQNSFLAQKLVDHDYSTVCSASVPLPNCSCCDSLVY